jgi:hypothetical protein
MNESQELLLKEYRERIAVLETVFQLEGKSKYSFNYWIKCAKKRLSVEPPAPSEPSMETEKAGEPSERVKAALKQGRRDTRDLRTIENGGVCPDCNRSAEFCICNQRDAGLVKSPAEPLAEPKLEELPDLRSNILVQQVKQREMELRAALKMEAHYLKQYQTELQTSVALRGERDRLKEEVKEAQRGEILESSRLYKRYLEHVANGNYGCFTVSGWLNWCITQKEAVEAQLASREAPEDAINLIIRDVAEIGDRTSPDLWPDAMLVTADELTEILRKRLASPQPEKE